MPHNPPCFPNMHEPCSPLSFGPLAVFIPFPGIFFFSYNEGQIKVQEKKKQQTQRKQNCGDCKSPRVTVLRVINSTARRHRYIFPPGCDLSCRTRRRTELRASIWWCRERMGPKNITSHAGHIKPSCSACAGCKSHRIAPDSHGTSASEVSGLGCNGRLSLHVKQTKRIVGSSVFATPVTTRPQPGLQLSP